MEEIINGISKPIINEAAYLIKFAVGYLLVGIVIFLAGNVGHWAIKTLRIKEKKLNEVFEDLTHWRVIYMGPFLLILISPYVVIPLLIILFIYMTVFR